MMHIDDVARSKDLIIFTTIISTDRMFPTTSNRNSLSGAGGKAEQLQHISLADGVDNTLVGINAGTMSATRGSRNTNVGANAGANADSLDSCTLVGAGAGNLATYASNVVAVGASGLERGFAVYDSVAVGSEAGSVLSQSRDTTLVGYRAGAQLASATQTTAVGSYAAYRGTNVLSSTFVGSGAAEDARSVSGCVAVGAGASGNIRDSSNNVAVGAFAATEATGNNYTYVGFSCASNAIGSNNVFVGCSAGAFATLNDSIIIGSGAGQNATGSNVVIIGGGGGGGGSSGNGSTILGAGAGANSSGDYVTDIGYNTGRNWIGNSVTFVGALAGNATGRGDYATGVGAACLDGGVVGDFLTAIGTGSGAGWIGSNSSFVGFQAGGNGGRGNRNQVFGSGLSLSGNDNVVIGSLFNASMVANVGNVVSVGSKISFGQSLTDSVILGKNVSAVNLTTGSVLIGSDFRAAATDNSGLVIAMKGQRALTANATTLSMGPAGGEYFVGNAKGVKLTVVSGLSILPVPPTKLTALTCTIPNSPIPDVVGNVYGGGTYVVGASSFIGAQPWRIFGQNPEDAPGNVWQSALNYDATGSYTGTASTTGTHGGSTFTIPGEWVDVVIPTASEIRWLNYFYPTNSVAPVVPNAIVAANVSNGPWRFIAGNSWTYSSYVANAIGAAATNDFYESGNAYTAIRYIFSSWAQSGSASSGANLSAINVGVNVAFSNPSTYLSDGLTTLGGPTNRAASFSANSTLLGPIGSPWVTVDPTGVFAGNLNVSTNIVVGGLTGQPNLVCVYGNDSRPTSNTAICGIGMGPSALRYNGFGHRWHNTFSGDLVTMDLTSGGYLNVLKQVSSPSVWGTGSVTCGDGIDGLYPNLLNLYGTGATRFDPFANTAIMGVGLELNTLRFNGYNHRWYNTRSGGASLLMNLDSGGNLYLTGGLQALGSITYSGTKQVLSTASGTATWTSTSIASIPIGVYSASGMYISTGNYWAASDRRKKFDVEEEDPAKCAAAVRAARLVTYETKDLATGRHLGFIAQEAADAVPGSVTLVRDAVPSVLKFAAVSGRTLEVDDATAAFSGEHVCGVRLEVGGRTLDANVVSVVGNAITVDVDVGAERAFVVGPIVDDFHALNYERMWATAFGATKYLLSERDSLVRRAEAAEAASEEMKRRMEATEAALGEMKRCVDEICSRTA
jgi:hypothetical protein